RALPAQFGQPLGWRAISVKRRIGECRFIVALLCVGLRKTLLDLLHTFAQRCNPGTLIGAFLAVFAALAGFFRNARSILARGEALHVACVVVEIPIVVRDAPAAHVQQGIAASADQGAVVC